MSENELHILTLFPVSNWGGECQLEDELLFIQIRPQGPPGSILQDFDKICYCFVRALLNFFFSFKLLFRGGRVKKLFCVLLHLGATYVKSDVPQKNRISWLLIFELNYKNLYCNEFHLDAFESFSLKLISNLIVIG